MERRRDTASRATPAPTTPAPTTRTSMSAWFRAVAAIASGAFARWKGPRSAAMLTGSVFHRRGTRWLLDDDLDALELLELGGAGRGHRAAQRPDQVHRAVGDVRGAEQDLLERADAADVHPLAARQL